MLDAIKSLALGVLAIGLTGAGALLAMWAVLAWWRAGFPLPWWLLIPAAFVAWGVGDSIRKDKDTTNGR